MRRELKDQLSSELSFSEIIGNSAALRRVLKLAQTVLHARQQSDWVVAGPHAAAACLGMNRSTLQARMRASSASLGVRRNRRLRFSFHLSL